MIFIQFRGSSVFVGKSVSLDPPAILTRPFSIFLFLFLSLSSRWDTVSVPTMQHFRFLLAGEKETPLRHYTSGSNPLCRFRFPPPFSLSLVYAPLPAIRNRADSSLYRTSAQTQRYRPDVPVYPRNRGCCKNPPVTITSVQQCWSYHFNWTFNFFIS